MRKNVFVFNGNVTGEGYIGRSELFEELMRDVFGTEKRSGSYVLRGLTRMGKSSLAKKCCVEAEKVGNNKLHIAWIDVGELTGFKEFLLEIVYEVHKTYRGKACCTDELEGLFAFFENADEVSESKIKRKVKELFSELGKSGAKNIIVLDEFDHAIRVFENHDYNFQHFRNLITSESYNISFVMTCRLPIKDIESKLPIGSNLRNCVNEKTIVGFDSSEMNQYFSKISECGVNLSEEQQQEIIYYGGISPFILSGLARGVLCSPENVPDEEISISAIYNNIRNDVVDYYDSLINSMKAEHLYSKMLQFFIGPKTDITNSDIKGLKRFGYIYSDPSREKDFIDSVSGEEFAYQTISLNFVEYLRECAERNDDPIVWEKLINTEKAVRQLIRNGITDEYETEEWEKVLREAANSGEKGRMFDLKRADRFIRHSYMDFGERSTIDLLSALSIIDLANILSAYWNLFGEVFDPPYIREDFMSDMRELHRARNPFAHGTAECLTMEEKDRVEKKCKKIEHCIVIHQNS